MQTLTPHLDSKHKYNKGKKIKLMYIRSCFMMLEWKKLFFNSFFLYISLILKFLKQLKFYVTKIKIEISKINLRTIDGWSNCQAFS
jgi:hypothetical protein